MLCIMAAETQGWSSWASRGEAGELGHGSVGVSTTGEVGVGWGELEAGVYVGTQAVITARAVDLTCMGGITDGVRTSAGLPGRVHGCGHRGVYFGGC